MCERDVCIAKTRAVCKHLLMRVLAHSVYGTTVSGYSFIQKMEWNYFAFGVDAETLLKVLVDQRLFCKNSQSTLRYQHGAVALYGFVLASL